MSKSPFVPVCFFFLAVAGFPFAAQAGKEDPALLGLGTGLADALQWAKDDNDAEPAAEFRVEYRAEPFVWEIRPWVGAQIDTNGALYGAGGILLDIDVLHPVVITPSFGIGLYHDGGGRDLDNTLEFRSQLELAYEFEGGSRLGVAVSHISNAGLGDRNPGTESAVVYYHLPVGSLF
ncbi:MAG: acyloxyacyl hydrolase [Pseudomonadota bacterium]|nr:acyloxyacyl hydrolase [Pseudomonadota bacterium]